MGGKMCRAYSAAARMEKEEQDEDDDQNAVQEKLMANTDNNQDGLDSDPDSSPIKEIPIGNDVHQSELNKIGDPDRETWGKKADFLLSVIGFAVDLANVWRFPYLCYKNGGGAFLIPYVLMLFLGGIPLFYMELALGQFNRKGAITCWSRICPLLKGVGYAVVLIAFYTDFFYNVIISWALYYFFASFTNNLPWTSCDNAWNTENCYNLHLKSGINTDNDSELFKYEAHNKDNNSNMFLNMGNNVNTGVNTIMNFSLFLQNKTSPAQEYFDRGVMNLHETNGVTTLGHIRWQLALCLLAVYLICYFSLWKGISTSGKVVWFTALFPYVVLFILLIRGVTLPGASLGIKYYLTPDFSRLLKSEVWVDAATQVFFSLGPGFGVLLAFASYNKFHNNVYLDALATSSINCLTSFLSGFVIFSVLGYMAVKSGKNIEDVATEGPGLVFIVYPEAIATLPVPTFWALIFFMMLLTLGLDSSFGGSEAIITALSDEFTWVKKHREIFVGLLFSFYFLVGLASCTQGGAYVVTLMDKYAAGYSILFAVFFETLAVSWLYGVERFSEDIEAMIGYKPGIYWKLCWKFIAPIFLFSIMIFGFVSYEPLKYENKYLYPWWANLLGWGMAMSSMLCMPVIAVYQIIITPGTFKQRLQILTTPWRDTQRLSINYNSNETKSNGSHPLEEV